MNITKVGMIKTGIDGISTLLSSLFINNKNKQLLDPLSSIIRLSVLSFKPNGTKISINSNKISYQSPNIIQGSIRWGNGDTRDDLHNLCEPIEKAIEWYNVNNICINQIFQYALEGLVKLRKVYKSEDQSSNLVCHSLSYYINILTKILEKSKVKDFESFLNNKSKSKSNSFNSKGIAIKNNSLENSNYDSNYDNDYDNVYDNIDNDNIDNGDTTECGDDSPFGKKDKMIQDEINEMNGVVSNKMIDNKLHDIIRIKNSSSLYKLWDEKEMMIIHNILILVDEKEKEGKKFGSLINAIDCILDAKDQYVRKLVYQLSTSL